MSLWVDKHRPKTLNDLHYHDNISENLKQLAASGDFPHLLFYGPNGAGKKTRIVCFLRELFGSSVDRPRIEHKSFKVNSKTLDISTIATNYHIEVNPSDLGHNDEHVVRTLLKDVALSQQLDTSVRAFKVIVLSEADKLSRKAQQALRRIMEKYTSNCRYILCCNSSSKVLGPIRSRCLGVRVAAPTREKVAEILQHVAKKESIKLPPELAARIARESERNLRRAILMLEACRVQQYPFLATQQVALCDWQVYLKQTAKKIVDEQSPARLLEVRGRLFELYTHCIPTDIIIKGLTAELMQSLDETLKIEVSKHAAFYEHRLQMGRKPIYHLEAFVAKFMSVYKKYLLELGGAF